MLESLRQSLGDAAILTGLRVANPAHVIYWKIACLHIIYEEYVIGVGELVFVSVFVINLLDHVGLSRAINRKIKMITRLFLFVDI